MTPVVNPVSLPFFFHISTSAGAMSSAAWFRSYLLSGIALGLAVGFGFALAGWRYVAFLLCIQRWNGCRLPWPLGSFLPWCYQAGVIRVAGQDAGRPDKKHH
jgi:hypothetical protein